MIRGLLLHASWVLMFVTIVHWTAHSIDYAADGLWDRAIHDASFDGLVIMLGDYIYLLLSRQRAVRVEIE
jgi:hypothetical protein